MHTSKTRIKVLPESEVEIGEYEREEQQRIRDQLQEWHAEQRANHERATQDQRFSQNILLQNRNIEGVNLPHTHPHVHAQILDILMLKMKCYKWMCSWQ